MTTFNVKEAAARVALRRARTATLATLEEDGAPYASLVNVATDFAGLPVIFASRLARHTRNLMKDARASLLVGAIPDNGDALAGSRVTVLGRFEPLAREEIAARYLAHHPAAQDYIDFADFAFWRLAASEIHGIAGFGRIDTFPAADVFLTPAKCASFAATVDDAVDHLNADHAGAIALIATKLLGAPAGDWRVAAVDPDGFHLVYHGRSLRGDFEAPVATVTALRRAFAALTRKAKS